MSYKTNTVANRLKINKGWKNALFPTKKWNYSREIILWFKLYLFLKAYLALKKIQLLFCEMRVSEKKTRILYLSINKIKSKKKKYARKTLILKKFKSALNTRVSRKAKNWLYNQNKFWLKRVSFWKYNNMKRKILTKLWISKPRLSSWINLTNIIQTQRQSIKTYQKIRQQKKIFLSNIWRNFDFLEQKKLTEKKLKTISLDLREKKLLSSFIRVQKNILFLRNYFLSFQFKHSILSTRNKKDFDIFFLFLAKHLEKQLFHAKQIYNLYLIIYKQNFISHTLNDVSYIEKHITKKYVKQKWQQTWKISQEKLKSFVIKTFIKTIREKRLLNFIHLRSVFYKTTLAYHFSTPGPNYFWKFILEWYYLSLVKIDTLNAQLNLFHNYKKFFSQKTFQTLLTLMNKTKNEDEIFPYCDIDFISRQNNISSENSLLNFFLKKSFNKKNAPFYKRVSRLVLKTKLLPKKLFAFQGTRFKQKLKEQDSFSLGKRKIINYRMPYRQYYLQNLKTLINYKIKYWLQYKIYEYFAIKFQVKFLWPLNQFKNTKYYRLAFPAKGRKKKKKKQQKEEDNISLLKKYKRNFLKKNYIYVAKTTNHLTTKILKKKSSLFKDNRFFLQYIGKNLARKRPYFLEKWTETQSNKKLRISRYSNFSFMKNLIPTLILFTKYLDPQLLANTIAKIIEKAKRHTWFLYDLRQIFRSLFIENISGYKIVLIGRVNGRKKTRILSIKNSKESNSQQTWLKQVNFGVAQARGRIGTFGIKVWIYN